MKATAEKSPTTTPTPATRTSGQPFFAKAGGGNFFEPATATAAPPVQMKLTVNKPGDKFEQEADHMADKVMRMPAPDEKLQRAPEEKLQKKEDEKLQKAPAPEEKIQRAELKEEKVQKKEDDKLQRKGDDAPAVEPSVQSAIQEKAAGGQPLAADMRSHMEPRFGADFSQVRVHNDLESAGLSNQLSARAFTYRNHIFFGRNQYQPGTDAGKQLLAHELTHIIQKGQATPKTAGTAPSGQPAPPSAIQKAAAPAGSLLVTSSEVVDVSGTVFSPSEKVKEEIAGQGSKGLAVRVAAKGIAGEGQIKVRVDRSKNYDSLKKGSMPVLNPWAQQLGGLFVNFDIINGEIKNGYASLKPAGGPKKDWLQAIKNNTDLLGGAGLKMNSLPETINTFENGKLTLGVTNVAVEIGGFLQAEFSIALENLNTPKIAAQAQVSVQGMAKGELKLDNAQGKLAGELALAITLKAFSGSANVKYNPDGTVDIGGKGAYNANKLSGEVQFVATDLEAANKFAKNAIAAAGGKENAQTAGPPAPVPLPATGKKTRALAATGQLAFNLTTWFAGSVFVVVDGKGDITVIGKIAPPAEIELFKQRDWDKELIKFEAKAYYGIPVVGNLNLFANISLHALAKLGPAKIYNIEILGTYSTDPDIQKSIQISASLNISAYAGLRLRAEGGAGVEILEHDLKFGIGLNADIGVKAYADARPTIGYRDPGEFYVSGVLEMVAQPMLGLGGDFFIQLETPWWSPLSDDKWTWPLFSKEWPLSDPIGLSATVKDYVLGSGKVPEVELKKPEFDPSKFMTSMVDKTLPEKTGGAAPGQGTFKEDGSVPKPTIPPKKPAPKTAGPKPAAKKGAPPKGGKSAAPDPKAPNEKASAKLLKDAATKLQQLKSQAPFTRVALNQALTKLKAQVSGADFEVKAQGTNWLVTPKAGGKTGKGLVLAAKDMKEGEQAAIKLAVPFDMHGEGHMLYTEVRNGKVVVEMASSQRAELLALTLRAKQQTANKTASKRLDAVHAKLMSAEEKANFLISDRTKDAEALALASKMTQDAANTLKSIGVEFGIPSLLVVPHKSQFVEASVTGYRIKSEYQAEIRSRFYPSSYEPATRAWKRNFLAAHTDPKNSHNFIDSAGRSEPKSTATIDHQPRVVEHWETSGKNSAQSVRATWYSAYNSGHMDIIAGKYNSSDGAEVRNLGLRYKSDNIGAGFSGPGES